MSAGMLPLFHSSNDVNKEREFLFRVLARTFSSMRMKNSWTGSVLLGAPDCKLTFEAKAVWFLMRSRSFSKDIYFESICDL